MVRIKNSWTLTERTANGNQEIFKTIKSNRNQKYFE